MSDKIVLLLGAGASKGATHIIPCDPPLGIELYDRLAKEFPKEWGPESHLGFIGEGLRRDFEKTLSDEVVPKVPSLNILEWQRPMALYFSRFSLDSSGEDFYSKLLRFLHDSRRFPDLIIGSLNYDCICEQAAAKLGLCVDYLNEESRSDTVRIIKVHGSCNFITENLWRFRAHLAAGGIALECRFDCVGPVDTYEVLTTRFRDPKAFYAPVMSLYSLEKGSLVASAKIQEMRNRWHRHAAGAACIVIIGVRPNERDVHIWEPIRRSDARILYIGAVNDYEKWRTTGRECEFLGETFEGGFEPLLRYLE